MSSVDKPHPSERSSTDEGLRAERDRTDEEIASRSAAMLDVANDVVAQAREQADTVLSAARDREDRKETAGAAVTHARAREDAALETARTDADEIARDERERRQLALAHLLAFEREYTDLQLHTERVQADQAVTSREDVLAMVSHDLRTLLGGIALSAELLKEISEKASAPPEQVRSLAERIQRCSARMNRLVGDLMDVASIEAGKLALVLAPRNARLVLRDAMDAFEPAAKASGIELRCESANDVGLVELDHERILQVLTNLVGNALKFTPRGGRIVIRMQRRGGDVCFSVADTGCGIAADMIDKIFERYFQSRDGEKRGLGLGLFISKSIVEAHGGTIWPESTPGQGTTIRFTIPCAT